MTAALTRLLAAPVPPTQMLPESLNYAIVDEADSILIDESRNPMILSQPLYDTAQYVVVVDKVRPPGRALATMLQAGRPAAWA